MVVTVLVSAPRAPLRLTISSPHFLGHMSHVPMCPTLGMGGGQLSCPIQHLQPLSHLALASLMRKVWVGSTLLHPFAASAGGKCLGLCALQTTLRLDKR